MTARVTTLKGVDAGAYYVEALPNYYLDSGEPVGVWHGEGARLLGLEGEIVDGEFMRIMAGLHPHSRGEVPLGRAYGDDSVRGFDVTASAPKSVSTLFAVGDDRTRAEVLAAHDTAVATMLGWVEQHAHTRYRINGEVAVVDAEGIIAATFRQHTSRSLDPQLHTHVVIANRVCSDDGRWLALDARSLKLDQRTLSAIYHATLRSELTERLGVAWQPVENGIAEMAHVSDVVLEEFSTRTAGVQRRIDEKIDRFIDTLERDPTPRERWRLEREAVIDSRPPKSHAVNADALHDGWNAQIQALGHDPVRLVDNAVNQTSSRVLDREVVAEMMAQAIAVLSQKQSTWRPAELTREIAAALPTDVHVDPSDIGPMLDGLTAIAVRDYCVDISRPVPDNAVLRRDGRPITESITDRALTTPEILAQEERLLAWAERRMARDGVDSANAIRCARVELTGPQAETAAAVAGDADLVLVVGPAGTGKTTALSPAVEQLRTEGRSVFGVAPSAAAADALASETGLAADTIDKLLTEHALERPPDHRYDLPTGATVIVDEAAMVSTTRLDQLAALADTRGWRVALVGDPMQFSAVGRGGMFDHLIDTHGAIELDQVHRFANDWERHASLRLRRGDPTVADVYDQHGRLHGGTATRMEQEALDVWWTARHNHEAVLLAAPTNDTVARLNKAAQQRRIQTGELDTRGRHVDASGYRFWAGDEIATRRNHRQLHTDQGLMIRNRDQWTIDTVHRNGDLTLHGRTGTIRLPADYVQLHVELGYAQTSHASQGRTVDRSILLLDGPGDVRGVYVPLTRGRHHNDAYIVTTGEATAHDLFADAITRSWIDRPAHARQAELAGHNPHRPGTLPAHELRTLLEHKAQLATTLDHLRTDLTHLPREYQRTRHDLDQATKQLNADHAHLQSAHDTIAQHDRPFRRKGHENQISDAHRTIDTVPDNIHRHETNIDQLADKIHDIDRRLHQAEQLDQQRPTLDTQLADIDARLGDDRRIRTRQIRRDPPDHITNTLGLRPAGGDASLAWDHAAGQLDQHQTAHNLTNGLGPANEPTLSNGFRLSRTLTQHATTDLDHAITRQQQQTHQIEGPGLGISR
ncbi:MAG: MobF family relaxase [Acidimicrobiales bacterium]|nr:MobF family relaxase [Acidimicrobiales bacterium]